MTNNYQVRVPGAAVPAPTQVSPQQAVASTQTSQALTVAASLGGSCDSRAFGNPSNMTLTAPTAVGAETCKMQSPDGSVENVLGSQGTVNFGVAQWPDVALLEIGGGTLFGINSLRRRLQTFAMLIGQINYQGTTAAQMSNSINILSVNVDGTSSTRIIATGPSVNNMQQVTSLLTLQQPLLLTAATLIKVIKAAGNVISLDCSQITYLPYNNPSNF